MSWACTGIPTYLLVLTLDVEVTVWAAQAIDIGHFVFQPVVAGPEVIPLLVDAEAARRSPELAVLAVRAHRHSSDVANVAAAALDAVSNLDQTRARFYSELVLQWLPAAARAILEATMDIKTEFISDWSREKIAQGEAIGEARGEARGEAKGRADALLRILGTRGIAVDDATAERVRSCTDLTQLDSWIERALRVTAANQLFD